MENHEYKIKDIVLISEHSDTEALRNLLEYEDCFDGLPFAEPSTEDFRYFDDWLNELIGNGVRGFVFKVASPVMCSKSGVNYYSWGYYREKLMHANSFEEAESKAQEYANVVAKEVEKDKE